MLAALQQQLSDIYHLGQPHDEGLSLSLYLDADMLDRLESANPLDKLRAESLDDLWKAMEGISHFNCMVWKATQDRSVSLLELELQGEIDKYVGTALLAQEQADMGLLNSLHGCLRPKADLCLDSIIA
jgi:hypothetical protein